MKKRHTHEAGRIYRFATHSRATLMPARQDITTSALRMTYRARMILAGTRRTTLSREKRERRDDDSELRAPFRGVCSRIHPESVTRHPHRSAARHHPPRAAQIQKVADKIGKRVIVVGSRAKGTATPWSDWDYMIEGNSTVRSYGRWQLPRGVAGGEYDSRGSRRGSTSSQSRWIPAFHTLFLTQSHERSLAA